MDRVAVQDPLLEHSEVTRDDVGFEFMLNALRLTEGVPSSLFAERTGYPLTIVQHELNDAVARGLLDANPARIAATPRGRRFLNDLQTLFLRDAAPPFAATSVTSAVTFERMHR